MNIYKSILGFLVFTIFAFSEAQFIHINPYESSAELDSMLIEACNSLKVGLLQSCKVNTDFSPPEFGPYTITGVIKGSFTRDNYEEALLEFAITDGESGPAYLLLQKWADGWHFLYAEAITETYDPFRGKYLTGLNYLDPMIFMGETETFVVTLNGILEADEMGSENFNIQVAQYAQNNFIIYKLLEMPRKSNYDNCHSRRIPEGESFAQLENSFQEDVDQDGFQDLVIHVKVRYWKDDSWYDDYPIGATINYSECLGNFESEDRLVIFYFDGYKFIEGVNVEWLKTVFN